MISKFSKLQNSFFAKFVLSATALSFVSLFGVSGYINSANSNKAVIKVDNIEVTQSEFSYLLQREFAKMNNNLNTAEEDTDTVKKEIAGILAKAKLEEVLIDNTMKKYNVDITEGLVQQIIFATPQFQDAGKFNAELFRFYLRSNDISEREFIANIKRNVGRRILIDSQIANINVPNVLQEQMQKILGQRRTFKYVKLTSSEAKIDREPTQEELDQYYEDFGEEFMVPEKRDITIMYLPLKNIEDSIDVTEEEIAAYYKEHIEEYEQPEQRHLYQLAFATKEEADAAAKQAKSGAEFNTLVSEQEQFLDMGFISSNDIADEMATAFSLPEGGVSEPVQFNDSWMVLKVIEITAAHKVPHDEAVAKVTAEIRQEKAYEGSYDIVAAIEDKIAAGTTLAEIASQYNIIPVRVNGLGEDGSSLNNHAELDEILHNQDVIDEAFSYNEGEISNLVEGDNGFAALQVEKIYEPHKQDQEEVVEKIKKIWLESEKNSITAERLDNIEHDLDAGDTLSDVANRYGLSVIKTRPITRGESFDSLSFSDIKELFTASLNEAQVIKVGDDYVIAETSNIYDDTASLTDEDKQYINKALNAQILEEMADALLKGYAKDYEVEVNYGRMGLTD